MGRASARNTISLYILCFNRCAQNFQRRERDRINIVAVAVRWLIKVNHQRESEFALKMRFAQSRVLLNIPSVNCNNFFSFFFTINIVVCVLLLCAAWRSRS